MKRIECENCNHSYFEDDKLRCSQIPCTPEYDDMKEVRADLLAAFPRSFFNKTDDFVAHAYSESWFRMENCEYPEDVECKVLEYLSRAAIKGQPYDQEWRNVKFREFMRSSISSFFQTDLLHEQLVLIYTKLGNAVNHELTKKFIDSRITTGKGQFDFSLLNK